MVNKYTKKDVEKDLPGVLDELMLTTGATLEITQAIEEEFIKAGVDKMDYTLPGASFIVRMLNTKWEKQIEKEKQKNDSNIEKGNIKAIIKDVTKSYNKEEEFLKSIEKMMNMVNSNMEIDQRFSYELNKCTQRMLTDSNEIFQAQKDFSLSFSSKREDGVWGR